MKVSYNWLKNYIDFDLSVTELAKVLTDTGLEVEGVKRIDKIPGGLEGLVIGKVTDCIKHEDADRLKVTKVDIGTEVLQIVCGAENINTGQKVVVATVGSMLYPEPNNPFQIKKAKIRGKSSFGMICAEDEIGLGDSHEGIMVLDEKAKIGTKASTYFNLSCDYQLEIGLTPNRCDAMGHFGVARDIKAYLNYHQKDNKQLQLPKMDIPDIKENRAFSIEVAEPELCPTYIGAILENIIIKPSPEWLQEALLSIDIEPINNVVDITNYVMFELGTPLHAFDLLKTGEKITIKKSTKGDIFTTLDGIERKLDGEELMITNGKENLCIAGVYGGISSGISNESKSVFLESAIFDSTSVRKTSKSHGLQTDASFRFERGVDPTLTEAAINRAIHLILEHAGGRLTMSPKKIDKKNTESVKIDLNINTLNSRLGITIGKEDIINILENLDFKCEKSNSENLNIIVPSYRRDVYRSEDIMEEVLRIYGFNQVPIPKKWHISFQNKEFDNANEIQRTLADWLVSNGFNEVINNSLSKDRFGDQLDEKTSRTKVSVLNPLSSELSSMRRSMLFGLLENIKYNQNRQHSDLKFFEFGKVYEKSENGFHETRQLAFVITGNQKSESWKNDNKAVDFFELKSISQTLGDKLGLKLKEKKGDGSIYFDTYQQLNVKKHSLIEYGEISSEVKKQIGFKGKVFAGVLNVDIAMKYINRNTTIFKELPKTFFVKRDFSLILDKAVKYDSIQKIALDAEKNLLKRINLFDVYEGANLPENKKSYAVSFVFQHPQDTLQDAQVDPIMEKIRIRLKKELGAELRA
ncbi:phenylalanine--tRNA ligase subunit beta [Crocinitomicaceae bacterium]|nr:phenylalanine--tRNA ligase subunit beta [Crocinitomicaceae bacterium]